MRHVNSWGSQGIGEFRFRVGNNGLVGSLVSSIERRTGLRVCAGPRLDSYTDMAQIFQLTLGRPCRGGGYSVCGEMWVAVRAK